MPEPWEAILLALAAWRVFQLLAEDDLTEPLRRYVTRDGKREKTALFIECPYCAGFWITLGWWASWQIWEWGTLVAAGALALHAGMIGAHKLLSSE